MMGSRFRKVRKLFLCSSAILRMLREPLIMGVWTFIAGAYASPRLAPSPCCRGAGDAHVLPVRSASSSSSTQDGSRLNGPDPRP